MLVTTAGTVNLERPVTLEMSAVSTAGDVKNDMYVCVFQCV